MAFDNLICPICGKRMMTAVHCPKIYAVIHMKHCYEGCQYWVPDFAHCRYRLDKMNARQRAVAESGLKQKIAACKGRLGSK